MSHNPISSNLSNIESIDVIRIDAVAFEKIFKKYFQPLCAFCQYKFGFDAELSKDIVHNAFIKLWESRKVNLEALTVKAYLYRVITNACLDALKHEKVKEAYSSYIKKYTDENASIHDCEQADDVIEDVHKAVAELPEQMRKVFELCRYHGFKYAEAASYLNISVKTVETQMSRALFKLRKKLSHHHPIFFIFFIKHLF